MAHHDGHRMRKDLFEWAGGRKRCDRPLPSPSDRLAKVMPPRDNHLVNTVLKEHTVLEHYENNFRNAALSAQPRSDQFRCCTD
jgi:hypothetical protein